jgi:hypothetical protein
MMDFLRRLAPPRETDAMRAFAVLPSRFASQNPLPATMTHARLAQRPDDNEAPLLSEEALPPAANNTLAAQRPPVSSVQPSPAASRPLASAPVRRDNEKAALPAYALSEASSIHVADPRAFQNRHGGNPERTGPASLEPQRLAAPPAGTQGIQTAAAPPAQARVVLPLSESILAQRAHQSQDDKQVVHVTIGRIDVVASPAPAPAMRRTPTPRQATVTLADYLRGDKGSRQ